MRTGSPSQFSTDPVIGLPPKAKSAVRTILAISHRESIFYPGTGRRHLHKSLIINNLANKGGRMRRLRAPHSESKSLFQNILAASPLYARIYPESLRSETGNHNRMSNLQPRQEKNVRD